MAMFVQHNMSAMNATRNLNVTTGALSKSTEKLSSGYRINRAGDDAAGLAISEKMRGQVRGLERASTNSQDGISLIQTAEGALTETHSILQRMRELSVQAASDTNTDDDRTQIQNEIDQLTREVDRIATTTEFNTKKLLDGSVKGSTSYKEGNVTFDGTFANGNVELSIDADMDQLSFAGFTDVIRLEVTRDVLTSDKWSVANQISKASIGFIKLDDLFGATVSANNGFTGSGSAIRFLASGGMLLFGYTKADISVGAKIKSGGATKLDLSNFTSLKAGDVITISLTEMTESEAATTGKEAIRLQAGANAGQEILLGVNSMKAKDLDIVDSEGNSLSVTSQADASMAISAYDMAIRKVSTERAKLGAVQNRLEHTIANLDTSAENLQSAESRIRDTDMAKEMTTYSKQNILMQAGQSMLAQANQSTQGVLSLLQ